MGMAASQGRLLFMTARISNNEFEQQCVAYSKQRLADDSQKANDQYLEALQATQYQILTGYNGDSPNYEPVTYNQLTALNSVAARKQYIVSDNKGQIVVTDKIARAFDPNYLAKGGNAGHTNVDFNTFLKNVSDGKLTQVEKTEVTETDVHETWDKYFTSVSRGDKDGIYVDNETDHILGFSYNEDNGVPYATSRSKYFTGSAGNRIYLNFMEQTDKNGITYNAYQYKNCKIEAEEVYDEYGQVSYRAKYKPPHYLYDKGEQTEINMMQDSDYIYVDSSVILDIRKDDNDQFLFKWRVGENAGDKLQDENGNDILDAAGNPIYYAESATIYADLDYNASLEQPYISGEYTILEYKDGKWYNHENYEKTIEITDNENIIFYEGTTQEQRDLYDYAMAVSEKYAKGNTLEYDADEVQYYKNIYQQMITKGFTTFEKMTSEGYINTMSYKGANGETSTINSEKLAFSNDNWLVTLLKNGKLSIAFYDSNDKNFVKTTLDDDESIVEKENKSKMAIAEQVYQTHMDRIESEDKRFDMQLTKLESEHQALTTEYDSVAKVISKNVEKSFNIFNA